MKTLPAALIIILLATLTMAGRAQELSPQEIRAAFKLYNVKCAKCHKFYDPAKYETAEWQEWMTRMSRKAKLKPGQQELLSAYLSCFRIPAKAPASGLPRPR